MSRHAAPIHPQLDAYLDGTLAPADQAMFENELTSSPVLQEQVALQRQIDASLTRLFGDASWGSTAAAAPREGRGGRWRIHPALLGLAAAVLIVSAALWLFAASVLGERPNRLAPLYHSTVAQGFIPQIVCTTPDEFAGWLASNYGQALYPADDPGIEYVGWSYAHVVSVYSGVLLARVDGHPVVVVMDRSEREDIRQGRGDDRGLTIHRRRLGELVLYEVTPLDRPRILPVLSPARP
jgi:hypothetical protein